MLAAVVARYGTAERIGLQHLVAPLPARGQVRVRVRASSLNPLDSKLRSGALWPFLRLHFPAVLGFDLAGEVDALGAGVRDFVVGDRVYGRIDARTGGGHAELAVVRASVLDRIPQGLSYHEAASLPLTGMTALEALRHKARLHTGQRLLVVGGAGGVGSMAIQIGRALGAAVTAVVGPESVPLAGRLGADRVLDYTAGDLERHADRYDVVFDTVFKKSFRDFTRLLVDDGVYVTTGFSPALAVGTVTVRLLSKRKLMWIISRADGALMRELSAMVTSGQLKPVIDSTWPIDRIREAYGRLETGHAHGKVVVTLP